MGSRSVFLYAPNLIGYVRVLLAIAALYYVHDPSLFLPLYALSCILDVADGYAARYLNQCSMFGAVLDMVTDRSTTAGLLCHLCTIYPRWTLAFQLLVALDLSSHYMQMYSSLSSGSKGHKDIDAKQHFLLRLYYTSRTVLFLACAFNETFFIALYMVAYRTEPTLWGLPIWYHLAALSAPVWLFKQVMNVIQLVSASRKLAQLDSQRVKTTPSSLPKVKKAE